MSWISALIGAASSIINTGQTNKQNVQAVKETNKANREMIEMQNKAAAQESEKAFKRSSAPTQVGLMTSAGMSRAGAINALNGGGSYTPAPVNTSQDTAPVQQPLDFSGLSNLAQIALQNKQIKQQERLQDKQIKAQADIEKNRLDFEKQKWNDEAATRSEQLTALQFQNKLNDELANYKDEEGKYHNLHVEGAAAERIANMAEARLNTMKNELLTSVLKLPANILKKVLIEANIFSDKTIEAIEDIRKGKKKPEEVQNLDEYLTMPNEVEEDGKKFKRIKKGDGSYEWIEVK